jgi:acyl-CoA synthetase (AMP-forming)/AMP-acid ligase II
LLLSQILTKAAKKYPEKPAVVCEDKRYTYSEFECRVKRLASVLKELGVKHNDKVAIIHKNCHYFLESYFATTFIGAVIVPINYRLSQKDFTYILNNSDAKVLIIQPEFSSKILPIINQIPQLKKIIWTGNHIDTELSEKDDFYETLIENNAAFKSPILDLSEDSMAQIYYTSGTTGKPKGVVLTHKNNNAHARGTIDELNLTERDNWLHVSPMFHLADAWSVWAITKAGGAHIIAPEFSPENVLKIIEQEKVTLSNFIPTLLNILVNFPDVNKYNYENLRVILSGGAPIAPEVIRKVIKIFKCNYIQTYGMTETSPFLTMSILKPHLKSLPFKNRFEYMITTGRAFANVKLKVVNEKNKEVKKNDEDVGEIVVKGDTITPEYWKLPNETSKRIKDGWLYTGDLAKINDEDYLTIVDRKDDMIITGGENVYSIEVENILYSHTDILEAAVIGFPDDIWGEIIVAAVVLKPEQILDDKKIIGFCKKHLAEFKVPKRIVFVDDLPKTGSNKISKQKLRELLCS